MDLHRIESTFRSVASSAGSTGQTSSADLKRAADAATELTRVVMDIARRLDAIESSRK